MEEITITQNGFSSAYMTYLFRAVKERFSFLPAEFHFAGDKSQIEVKTERAYFPYIRKFTEDKLADILVIGYKYAYFDKRLRLPLLKETERRILLTALVSADYKEDKAYAIRKLHGVENYSLDGLYHFKMRTLIQRWQDIVECVPVDMGEASLDNFLGFLTEDGNGKVYLKGGQVYDEEYKRQEKSSLTGKAWAVGELLLSGAEKVYCVGETDGETKRFLNRYYGEKATFC